MKIINLIGVFFLVSFSPINNNLKETPTNLSIEKKSLNNDEPFVFDNPKKVVGLIKTTSSYRMIAISSHFEISTLSNDYSNLQFYFEFDFYISSIIGANTTSGSSVYYTHYESSYFTASATDFFEEESLTIEIVTDFDSNKYLNYYIEINSSPATLLEYHSSAISLNSNDYFSTTNIYYVELAYYQIEFYNINTTFNEIYDYGYFNGYGKGSIDGYEQGETAGEITGYNNGYTDGFNIGYESGLLESDNANFEFSWLETLFNGANTIFSIEIFNGFKLWYLFAIPLIIALIVGVLKFLR